MKLVSYIILSFLMTVTEQVFAEKMLVPPNGQMPECSDVYDAASQPKTAETVLSAMQPRCSRAGGVRVMHKIVVQDNFGEPKGMVFTCIGNDPNIRVFSCFFSTSYEDL